MRQLCSSLYLRLIAAPSPLSCPNNCCCLPLLTGQGVFLLCSLSLSRSITGTVSHFQWKSSICEKFYTLQGSSILNLTAIRVCVCVRDLCVFQLLRRMGRVYKLKWTLCVSVGLSVITSTFPLNALLNHSGRMSGGARWSQVLPGGSRWCHVVPGGAMWCHNRWLMYIGLCVTIYRLNCLMISGGPDDPGDFGCSGYSPVLVTLVALVEGGF